MRDDRLDGAILAAYFVPVLGNILWRPVIGLQQTLLFVAGVALLVDGDDVLEASGLAIMAAAWIWSLVTLEVGYRRRHQHET